MSLRRRGARDIALCAKRGARALHGGEIKRGGYCPLPRRCGCSVDGGAKGGVSWILEMRRASLAAGPAGLLCDRLHPVAMLPIGLRLANAETVAACCGDAAVDGRIAETRRRVVLIEAEKRYAYSACKLAARGSYGCSAARVRRRCGVWCRTTA